MSHYNTMSHYDTMSHYNTMSHKKMIIILREETTVCQYLLTKLDFIAFLCLLVCCDTYIL